MAASASSLRAFSTSQRMPAATSAAASSSDSPTLAVPTRTGRPAAWTRAISATRAARFASRCVNTTSGWSTRIIGRWVRDDDRAQAVERLELLGRGVGGGGHAGEARVEAQEVLQRDLAEDPALGAEPQALLGLDRGVQPVGPVALVGDAAGRLVHELDLPPRTM